MKIIFVVEPRKTIGGGVRAAINLANKLVEIYDVEVSIWGVYDKSSLPYINPKVKIEQVNTLKPFSVTFIKSFSKYIRKENPDIIHVLGLFTALVGIFIKRSAKLVCTVHRVTMAVRQLWVVKLIAPFIAKRCSLVTFLTDYQKSHYQNNLNFEPSSSVVLPNVIIKKNVDKETSNELNSKLRRDEDELLISYVGRIVESKNLESFIEIITELNKTALNVTGLIVGGGPEKYLNKLKAYASEFDIQEQINFYGYTSSPEAIIHISDYILFPTKHGEALPNLIIESFSQQKLVIASNIPQLRSIISHKINGILVNGYNALDYMKEIVSLERSSKLKKEMENNSYSIYKTDYTPNIVTEKYYNEYEKLLQNEK